MYNKLKRENILSKVLLKSSGLFILSYELFISLVDKVKEKLCENSKKNQKF